MDSQLLKEPGSLDQIVAKIKKEICDTKNLGFITDSEIELSDDDTTIYT